MIYNWTTYPLTCLLEQVWRIGNESLQAAKHPKATLVELCASLEQALNFMHTGNAAVIATSLMNPLWLGLSIVQDGLPCLNMRLVPAFTSALVINDVEWPYNAKGHLKSASKGSWLMNYGEAHYNVSSS
jgi:hypothetical protein